MLDVLAVVGESATTPPRRDAPDKAIGAVGTNPTFVRNGEMWILTWGASTVHVKASKGMNDLATLLSRPGVEIRCVELIGAAVEDRSTGDVIDTEARRQYEDRLRELQVDIDDARADNDHVREERAQVEFDAIVDHLTAALGLGGRSRRHADAFERARSAVTQRLRGCIKRIEVVHPTLGAHLRRSIVTGSYCSYRPETPVDWTLA